MEFTSSPVVRMTREECLHHLGTSHVGRIGCTMAALPVIRLLPFRLSPDDEVLTCVRTGTTLERAIRSSVVTFQVDQIDADTDQSWSVSITGIARARDRHGSESVFAISTELVSGRRFTGGWELATPTPLLRSPGS